MDTNYYKYRKYKTKYLNHKKYIKYKAFLRYTSLKSNIPTSKLLSRNGGGIIKNHRFVIFAGEQFYPLGGWKDFYSYADTKEGAYNIYNQLISERNSWVHVVDMVTGTIVYDY